MAGDDTRLRAWAYLARVAEPPNAAVLGLVEALGPEEAAAAIRARTIPSGHPEVLEATEARHESDSAAADLERVDRIGGRLLTRDDPQWPAWQLLALGTASTAVRGGEPLALWLRGSGSIEQFAQRSIAIVGSRAASGYGEQAAGTIAAGLVAEDWAIISGGAFGIDAVAHRAALATGGATAAVLACGVDRDYPAAHSVLLRKIAETGLVISEYPPGTTAAKHRFLTRNRLVAALSQTVVVVEAGRRSGALNTAAWARRIGRPLGAVPGPITSATSVGCHQMIGDGQAGLVASAAAAISLAAPDGDPGFAPSESRLTDLLTDEQRRVHDAIPARGAVTVEEIAFAAGLPIAAVRRALAVMEVRRLVEGTMSGWQLN